MLVVPVNRYRFDCIAHTPIRLPDYTGSLLRGAFGRALRQVACITREKDCTPCALKYGCSFYGNTSRKFRRSSSKALHRLSAS
jgi:hypothetical protein